MDKNIAAFLREDAFTVKVTFDRDETQTYQVNSDRKKYTYVSNIPLAVGDKAVVLAPAGLSVVTVVSIDSDLDILPNADKEYKWIIAKIDTQPYKDLLEANKTITATLAKAYASNVRRQFAQQMLASLDSDAQSSLNKLLGK